MKTKTKIEQFFNKHHAIKRIYIHTMFIIVFIPFLLWGAYQGFEAWQSAYWTIRHGG